MRGRLCLALAAAVAVIGYPFSASADPDDDPVWFGQSNSKGGVVYYGYRKSAGQADFDPELAESRSLALQCNGYDGTTTIELDEDLTGSFQVGTKIRFRIDGTDYNYGAGLSYIGGDYTAVPTVVVQRGDPLLAALMSGANAAIFLGERQIGFEVDLAGATNVFIKNLRLCLRGGRA